MNQNVKFPLSSKRWVYFDLLDNTINKRCFFVVHLLSRIDGHVRRSIAPVLGAFFVAMAWLERHI